MFTFKWVRSIDDWKNKENKKVIWYTNSNEDVFKRVLSKYSITILSFNEYDKDIEWNVYEFWIFYEDESADVIISIDWKIREAFSYFIENFWIQNLNYLKPYGFDLTKEQQKTILDKLYKEFLTWQKVEKPKSWDDKSMIEKKVSAFGEKKLELFKQEINDFIWEINEILPEFKIIDPVRFKTLNEEIWNLLKYRSTTNIFKLADHYKKSLEISEKLYDKYYDKQRKDEKDKVSESLISDIDIIKEYKNYQKVQRVKTLEKINAKEYGFPWYEVIYYKLLWKYWVNLKLLFKEFLDHFKHNNLWIKEIFKFIQFVIIFILIFYSLFLLYNFMFSQITVSGQIAFYTIILNIAIFWFIITVWKIIYQKKSIVWSIVTMIILFYLFYFPFKFYFGF